MNSKGKVVGAGKGYRARNPQVAPVTKAVRSALAVSALALAAVSGTAFACDPPVVVGSTTSIECNDPAYATSIIGNAVDDLTVVINNLGGGVAITPGLGEVGIGLSAGGNASLGIYGGTTITTNGAAGVSVFAYGQADVTNAGSIYATDANGIEVIGFDGASVVNDGSVNVTGSGYLQGISVVSPYGLAEVVNNGSVDVYSDFIAIGVYAGGAGGASITNNDTVSAYGLDGGAGLVAYGYQSGVTIDNQGAVYAGSKYGIALGIVGLGDDANINNDGYVGAFSFYGDAIGIQAYGAVGGANVTNGGTARATSIYGNATGILAYAQGTASVANDGAVIAQSYFGQATGIEAFGDSAYVSNYGNVLAYGYYGDATGISASGYSVAGVVNNGLVVAETEYGQSVGINVAGGTGAAVYNTGGVYSFGYLGAYGVVADGGYGSAQVSNVGGLVVAVTENGYAAGILAYGDTAIVYNTGGVYGISNYGGAVGISAEGSNGAGVDSTGLVRSIAYLDATAIRAYTDYGLARISNSGDAIAQSDTGNAFGLYAYSTFGDASVVNTGDAIGIAYNGIGDGIFASGYNVSVDNQGVAVGVGYLFGAGIEAQGAYSVDVTNGAGALAYGYGGYYAFGIYATGGAGGAVVSNDGTAVGLAQLYGFGIYAESGGDTTVVNSATGVVVGGDLNNTIIGTGIHAGTYAIDGTASVDNAGIVQAAGYYGGIGIEALALSPGGVASVVNSGSVEAQQYSKYGVGAAGIVAIGDGYASVENQYGGYVSAISGGQAYGILAISQGGDASVVNAGDVIAQSTSAALYYGAYGVVAAAGYGFASVDNSGLVLAQSTGYGSGYNASAIVAQGTLGASVANSGYAVAEGKYANGIIAISGQGDATVDNSGLVGAYGKYAYGIQAISSQGDGIVNNSGGVYVDGLYVGAGLLAISTDGNARVDNSGRIEAYGGYVAYGVFAASTYGDATVINSGFAGARSDYDLAVGIGASGDNTLVDNTGAAYAIGYGQAIGIFAAGDTLASVSNSGDVVAAAYFGDAVGIRGQSGYGDVNISSIGYVAAVSGYYDAIGIFGYAPTGITSIHNDGEIYAVGKYGNATGILAFGDTANVTGAGNIYAQGYYNAVGIRTVGVDSTSVDVSGDITALAEQYAVGIDAYAGAGGTTVASAGVVEAQAYVSIGISGISVGDVSVTNSGDVVAGDGAYSNIGIGVRAASGGAGASVVVDNSGTINASGYYVGVGIDANAVGAGGTVSVTNSGSIYAYQGDKYGYGSFAILAGADGDVGIDNSGLLDVYSAGDATGIGANSFSGNVTVTSSGDIVATSTAIANYGAYGIVAQAQAGDVVVDNGGSIDVDGKYAIGVLGIAYGDVTVGNAAGAVIDVYSGLASGFGVYAYSITGNAVLDNAGDLTVGANGLAAGAFVVAGAGDATITSGGNVTADSSYGTAIGLLASSYDGIASVSSGGDLVASAAYGDAYGLIAAGQYADASNTGNLSASGFYDAIGVQAQGYYGASATNDGSVLAEAVNGRGIGVMAMAYDGDAAVGNTGDVTATSLDGAAVAAYAESELGGASIDNSGSLLADSTNGQAIGAIARSQYGTATVTNAGDISANAYSTAAGVVAYGYYASVDNSGSIEASGSTAFGAYALAYFDASIANSGSIYAYSQSGTAVGAFVSAYNGDASLSNAGDITAYSYDGFVAAAYVVGQGSASADNSGTITGTAGSGAGSARGLVVVSDGDVDITNSGTISAEHDTLAVAVLMSSTAGTARLSNSGLIDAGSLGGGSIAIAGGNTNNEILNTGRINGHIITGDGDDLVNNGASGEWYLGGSSTNLGAGADVIDNAGLVVIGNGTVYLGDGDDAIVNSGDMVLGYAGIDLGAADTVNTFDNTGTLHVIGDAFIQMGAGGTLYSDGAISFLDGATDDMMTIYGNFAGAGDVNVDVDFVGGTSDMLYVEGDITGDVKTINVAAVNLPNVLDFDPIDVVIASGTAAADSFVAGQLFGFESELLDFGLSVEHSVVGTDNVFSIGIQIDGLSDAGNLSVTLAPAVHSMIGNNVGTLRQRLGVLPDLGGDLNGLGPWVRRFTSSGDIDASGTGFAAGEDLRFSNDVDGTEVGMNFTLGHGFHYGVLLGKTDNNRALLGGVGRDDIELDSAGLYATWLADNFYVDASWRWMDFDSRMRSGTGEYRASGNARAINLEAGYTGWELGGFSLVPQVQYTRASIDNIDSISGTLTEVALDGGDSERLRLGLGFERSFATAGGYRVTPYGSINAVNEMDGTSSFIVNGNAALSGEVEADGTYGMVELGLGVQKNRWSASAGLNWADGGAVDSDFGGQVVVRYTW
ncbi:hypothetical protein [Arenimonas caeni]|uniref:Autotransporter domain-containing protein n=1 Tax=Arenimonas caeni TaxID=2058085 RepID=A0A2P6M9B4_9GAMM|nr:hypothetical protein [Arenimonas caeni]PRH82587.1 hypothetical protein C6N40_07305 [Arenimonas caeni]